MMSRDVTLGKVVLLFNMFNVLLQLLMACNKFLILVLFENYGL